MLILASTSQTRKALLHQAGLDFVALPASIDERRLEQHEIASGGGGRDVALVLARHKAETVSLTNPDAIVIGADQTLALGPELLHKPSTLEEANAQLEFLRGKTHRLHAGVAVAKNGVTLWSDVQTAELTMRDFTIEERDQVLRLEGDAILSSVGSYRLEGPSIRLFEAVSGDYFTILGLPLLPLLAALRDIAPHLLDAGN